MSTEFLAEYTATIGMDVFKDKVVGKIDHQKLKDLVNRYLKRKSIENYNSTLSEEVDFEGFCDYARSELIEDIKKCIFSSSEKQYALKRDLLSKAINYANAKTNIAQQKIQRMTEDILDILIFFYRTFKTDQGMLLLIGELERKLDDALISIETTINQEQASIETTINQAQASIEAAIGNQHKDTREIIGDVKEVVDFIKDKTVCDQNTKSKQIDSIIAARKENILEYSLFPWFKGSIKYRDAFPNLFIDPSFRGEGRNISFSDIKEYVDRHIAVLGDAGAGKSTVLRYLFAFGSTESRKCMYIMATEVKKRDCFLDKLFDSASVTEEKYLVFIDGIDEEFANDFAGFSEFILWLQNFPNVRFWLGCRSDFYNRYHNENFAFISNDFTIEPWSPEQANRFIEKYAEITNKPDLKEQVNGLLLKNEIAQQFSANPFQLSLLVFLAEHNEDNQITGVYELYERFIFRWIQREKGRGTSPADETMIMNTLTTAAEKIYAGEKYILDTIAVSNSAVRNLLNIHKKEDLSYVQYAFSFYHRSLAAFLLAHKLVESFLNDNTQCVCEMFSGNFKDDVTNFIGSKFTTLSSVEKCRIKQTLIKLYANTADSEINIKEQIVYYITRLGIDVTDFLTELVRNPPQHPIMKLTIAYGCVLSEDPTVRNFALDYAKSIAEDSPDAITNRAWTVIYFGDVNDRDPYEYTDNEKRPWTNARNARIRRFTKKEPRLKDYRFRLFDIPLFHSFLKDREWNDISIEEYDILSNTDFPEDEFSREEIEFLTKEKEKLLREYRKKLE